MCLACPRKTEALPPPGVDAELDEVYAYLRQENAQRDVPHAVCATCGYPFADEEGGWLLTSLCGTCESNRIERLLRNVVKARSKRRRRRALKVIERICRH
jgi:predicted Zn-ribbon and HTH transcriptional regulator